MNTLLSLLFTTKFSSARQFKNRVELFSTFLDESRESQCKICQRKQTKTLLIQFQWFIFYKLACLRKHFHGRVLSIRVFSAGGHYGLIVSLRGLTLEILSTDVFEPRKSTWKSMFFILERFHARPMTSKAL